MQKEISVAPERFEDGALAAGFTAIVASAATWYLLPKSWAHGGLLALTGGALGNPEYPALAGLPYLAGLGIGVFSLAAIGGLSLWAFIAGKRPPPNEVHISGPRLLEGKQGINNLQALENKLFSKAQKAGKVKGLIIGGVEFSRKREVAHFRAVGLPGSGKTVLLNNVVLQIIERGEKMFLHDPKGDFTSWLPHNKDQQRVIFGPWDKRGVLWAIAEDVNTPALANMFAGVVFPKPAGGEDFWNQAARECFAAIIMYIQRKSGPYIKGAPHWSFDSITEVLDGGGDNVIEKAQLGNPGIALLLKKAPEGEQNKTADNIMASMMPATAWIGDYGEAYKLRDENGNLKPGFSVIKYVRGEYKNVYAVILKNDSNNEVRAAAIFGALMGAASGYINGPNMPEIGADKPGLWVILDEYPQLGTGLGAVVQKMEELGRSRGVRVFKALQDESQSYEQYGREKGRAQNSVQQTRIYCKLATETAREISGNMGNKTVNRLSVSTSAQGTSTSMSQVELPAITPDKLTGLSIVNTGAEIVVNIDSEMSILVQKFAPAEKTKEIHPKVLTNELWEFGAFKRAERAERAATAAAAAAKAGSEDKADKIKKLKAATEAKLAAMQAPAPAPAPAPGPAPAPAPAAAAAAAVDAFDPDELI